MVIVGIKRSVFNMIIGKNKLNLAQNLSPNYNLFNV